MAETMWMVRAGQRGTLFEEFAKGYVGIGWGELGDLGVSPFTEDEIKELYASTFPKEKGEKAATSAGMVHTFRSVMAMGDRVITFNPHTREYLTGTITSGYMYRPEQITGRPHVRSVKWEGAIKRESLSPAAREALRSNAGVFAVDRIVSQELQSLLAGEPILTPEEIVEKQLKKQEIQRRRIARGWVAIGFGVFILATGIFLYIYASGQTHYLNELEAGDIEQVTMFFWLGEEITRGSAEYQDALDFLEWIKRVGLGAGIVGAIMIALGAARIIWSKSPRMRRIV